jgi:hypothetical protein
MGLVIAGASAAVYFDAPAGLVLPAAIPVVGLFLFSIANFLINGRRSARARASIRAGWPQVDWRCEPGEWRRFLTTAEASMAAQARPWKPILLRRALVFVAALFLSLTLLFRAQGPRGLIVPVSVSAAICGMVVRSARRIQQSLRYPYGRGEGPPRIVVSSVGSIVGAQVFLFRQPRVIILSTDLTRDDPRVLRIETEFRLGRGRSLPYSVLIPVPKGQEEQAELIRRGIPVARADGSQP